MEIPNKIYFDAVNKVIRDSAGTELTDANLFPSATFGNKMWFNLKLVKDAINTAYDELPTGSTAEILVDDDYNNPSPILPIPAGNANWTAGTGSEYYYNGTDITTKPTNVYENDVEISEATQGALTAPSWDWDTVNSRLYVRLTDSADPDTKAAGWVEFKELTTGATDPFIEVDGSTFNQAGSWYDTATLTFRDPVITDGELSFYITANTLQFYRRIGSSASVTDTTMQIQMLTPSTALNFITFEFPFICKNKYLGQGYSLDVTGMSVYTKAETLALVALKEDVLSGTQVALTDNATANITAFDKTTARGAVIDYVIIGASGMRQGVAKICFFSSTAHVSDNYIEGGAAIAGITLGADISSNNVRLNVTLASTGENLKMVYRISQIKLEV